MCGEKDNKFFKCCMRKLVNKLRKEGQVPKALNHTISQDVGEEYKLSVIEAEVRLHPQTRKVSSLLNIASNLTIARPELKDFSQDI